MKYRTRQDEQDSQAPGALTAALIKHTHRKTKYEYKCNKMATTK